MNQQANPKVDLEMRVLNKVLAQLYLDLMPASGERHPRAAEILDKVDRYFYIKRPSVSEMRQSAKDLLKADRAFGSEMRSRILEDLIVFCQGEFGQNFEGEMRARMQESFNAVLADENVVLSSEEGQRLFEVIVTNTLGWGPLEPLLDDETVAEILVDGPDHIYVERNSQLEDVPDRFHDNEHLMSCIRRILTPLGRRLNESVPMVDARLPDGSFVNIVIPPISLTGPTLTIRKYAKWRITLEDLLRWGCIGEDVVEFLRPCFLARLNVVVAGGTSSGKTTLLNILAGMIPDDERIVTVETKGELKPPEKLKHIVRLASRPPDWEGKGEVTMRDLVLNALRMRPDRVILSECHGAEVFDMHRAMNTGHDGSMLNLHANGPRDVMTRLETMALMANPSLPLLHVRHELASAVDLIIYQERLTDGTRKVLNVTEVQGMVGDTILLQDIFEFRKTGVKDGKIVGHHTATGHIPRFLDRIQASGVELPMSIFTPS